MSMQRVRRVLVLAVLLASIAVSYGQIALNIGMTPQAFAAEGDTTLQVASYAFSIWGVIYAGLLVYGVYQFLPKAAETPLLNHLGWASIATFAGISAWVVAAAANAKWATVILIFASALVLTSALAAERGQIVRAERTLRMLTAWPLALLAGWLTIATIANLVTVLTAKALLGPIPPLVWGLGGVAIAAGMAFGVAAWTRLWVYAVPILWGLVGVFNAEREDGDMVLALAALAAAFLAAMALAVALARPHRQEPGDEPIPEPAEPSQSPH